MEPVIVSEQTIVVGNGEQCFVVSSPRDRLDEISAVTGIDRDALKALFNLYMYGSDAIDVLEYTRCNPVAVHQKFTAQFQAVLMAAGYEPADDGFFVPFTKALRKEDLDAS